MLTLLTLLIFFVMQNLTKPIKTNGSNLCLENWRKSIKEITLIWLVNQPNEIESLVFFRQVFIL
jgi:hypothetical protein